MAQTSAFAFKGKSLDVRTIGSQLGVTAELEGSVRRLGNRLRIAAQLVNVADGFHLWSDRYDREIQDVFAIQDEISQTIAKTLTARLVPRPEWSPPSGTWKPTRCISRDAITGTAGRTTAWLSRRGSRYVAALGCLYAQIGDETRARASLAELDVQASERYVSPADRAVVLVALGEFDQAFENLERAYDERSGALVFLRLDPEFARVASDPRFTNLISRMKFPDLG